jgi:uncharacterized protein (UPF0335 family)
MEKNVSAKQLTAFIERLERLIEEKQALQDDIKEIYSEAKGAGFDTKAMRAIIKLRAKTEQERKEQEQILDLYKSAIGME